MSRDAKNSRVAQGGITGFFKRVRTRLNSDSGDAMIEVLGVMVVVGILTSMFAQSAISLGKSQNRSHNADVSIQVARGVLEQAKATPWNKIGFASSDAGYQPTLGNVAGAETTAEIPASELSLMPGRILPLTVTTVRRLPVTTRTDITFTDADKRTKRISVTTVWNKNGRTGSSIYSLLLAASPNDKSPVDVPMTAP